MAVEKHERDPTNTIPPQCPKLIRDRTTMCSAGAVKVISPPCSMQEIICPHQRSSQNYLLSHYDPCHRPQNLLRLPHRSRTMMTQLVPTYLTPYLGYLNVPKHVFQTFISSSQQSDVETCGTDSKTPSLITWDLPNSPFRVDMQLRWADITLHFRLGPPRLVRVDAEIWAYIAKGDLDSIRTLFGTGSTSIYDVREDGVTLLSVSDINASNYRHVTNN